MNKKIVLTLLSVPVVAALGACSTLHTTVIPQQNHYTVVATAESGPTARSGAVKRATQTCSALGKRLAVMKMRTIYQGSGKALGEITQIAGQASFQAGGPLIPSTKQANDYKTTMTFRCK